jgi:hypothetical protein
MLADPFAERAARVRAWRRTRDPRALWPHLDPRLLEPAARSIGHVVAARLGDRAATLGAADGRDAYAIGIAALLTGTGPLLGRWVEDGSLDVSDALAAILALHLAHGRARVDRITRGLSAPLGRLVMAGVTPVVIKGYHTAHVYFPEPGLRPMSDVDLVVTPHEVPAVEEALRAAGFTPSGLVGQPYKRNWAPPDDDDRVWSFELFDARDRWQIEVHDGPNFGYLLDSGFRIDGGFQPTARWQIDGLPVQVAAQPLLTTLLAAHLSGEPHSRRLIRLVELVLVIRRDRPLGLLVWEALEDLLQRSDALRFVYPALALTEQLAPGTVDASLLARGRRASTRLTRLVTDRFTPAFPVLEDRLVLAARLMWVANPRDLARFTARWLNPYPGRPWRDAVEFSYSRVRRMLSGAGS